MPAVSRSRRDDPLTSTLVTPIGPFSFTVSDGKVMESTFGKPGRLRIQGRLVPSVPKISALIRSYFAGDLTALDRIPVEIAESQFRTVVLRKMRGIKAGKTLSYQDLATRAGSPKASRAVGSSCANNRIPLIVPCHRVTRSDGSLGRYAFGEKKKRWLLEFEGAIRIP